MIKGTIVGIIKRYKRKKIWAANNRNNGTYPVNDFQFNCVKVGRETYGGLEVLTYNDKQTLTIGHYCSIASGAVFVLSADHYLDHISTFPFKTRVISGEREGTSKGDITVSDDVWIGQNAVILSGVTIGQGAVIAAGAVVTSNVPPYTIVGGIPAKAIRKRFSDEAINYLMKLDYSQLDRETITKHEALLYKEIDGMTMEELNEQFIWFPKKHEIKER